MTNNVSRHKRKNKTKVKKHFKEIQKRNNAWNNRDGGREVDSCRHLHDVTKHVKKRVSDLDTYMRGRKKERSESSQEKNDKNSVAREAQKSSERNQSHAGDRECERERERESHTLDFENSTSDIASFRGRKKHTRQKGMVKRGRGTTKRRNGS